MKTPLITSLLISALMAPAVFAGPVNINQADVSELKANLSGIGEAKAEAIVAYRESHGSFHSAEELVNVKGIGEALLEKNRDLILVDAAATAEPAQ